MTGTILFNGIQYPFSIVEKAIEWAKINKASLQGIFLKSADEVKEGYIFPSDLDSAEDLNDNEDTENANVRVIKKNMEVLKGAAQTEHINCQVQLLTDPDKDELANVIGNSDQLFVDEHFEESGILKTSSINLKDLQK